MEINPQITFHNEEPIYIQLYTYLKNEILAFRLLEGEVLPSVRKMALYLGLSKTTIENAYQQLVAEGYIYSRPQRGFFVSKVEDFSAMGISRPEVSYQTKQKTVYQYDFKSEYVEKDNFNVGNWKKHINEILNYKQDKLFDTALEQGEEELRVSIAKYIHRTRGVNADERKIIVGAGVQTLLNILAFLLREENIREIAIEDPGFNKAKFTFSQGGYEVLPLPVGEKDIDVDLLKDSKARLCYISPSHQFPTGRVMLIDTRIKLIKWAYRNNGYIIEDDFNSELRYEGKPIPAMQGLDRHQRVIYLGSFSTVLAPSIRISFIHLTDRLQKLYDEFKYKFSQTASKIEQLALSNMMESGDFEKHIRRIKKNYAKKNEYTLKMVERYLKDQVEIIGMNSGLNILLKLKAEVHEQSLLTYLKSIGINISGISEYRIEKGKKGDAVLILRYRGIETEKIQDGLKYLSHGINEYLRKGDE